MPRVGTCTTLKKVFDGWAGTKYDPQVRWKYEFDESATTRKDCEGTWSRK